MAEAALKLVETSPVEEKALTIVDQAKAVKVTDNETYIQAGSLWKQIGDMIKEVQDTFNPICEAAHRAHKAATEKRAKYLDPLAKAQKDIKGLMANYDAEQERIRKAEEARLAEIARKEEEERKLQDAILAEMEGNTEEAEKIMEEPVAVAPVVVPKATPKLTGGPVYREVWSAEIIDIMVLCRAVADGAASTELVLGNMPALNKLATAMKSTMNIPGVRAVSRRV